MATNFLFNLVRVLFSLLVIHAFTVQSIQGGGEGQAMGPLDNSGSEANSGPLDI